MNRDALGEQSLSSHVNQASVASHELDPPELLQHLEPPKNLIAAHPYFSEEADGGWWYRGENKHLRYWLGHVLPVVMVHVELQRLGVSRHRPGG
jgi:hypothetical protein